jgi:Kef-type K+ transport system membrane component KefB
VNQTILFALFHQKKIITISLIGNIPAWTNAIWPQPSLKSFQLIANLGLIFFMFFLGLELDLDQIKKSWRITLPVAAVSIVIPGELWR